MSSLKCLVLDYRGQVFRFSLYVCKCFACLYVCVSCVYLAPKEARRGLSDLLELELCMDGCEPPYECWDSNSGPVDKQPVLLTAEPSLQPYKVCVHFMVFVLVFLRQDLSIMFYLSMFIMCYLAV